MPRPDITVTIDEGAPAPPYVQIFEQIRALVERGDLPPGEFLPPVRQLAGDLGVAPNTVARAYTDLKSEGWITGAERRPARVAARVPAQVRRSRRAALSEAVAAFLSSLASRGYAEAEIAHELRARLPIIEG